VKRVSEGDEPVGRNPVRDGSGGAEDHIKAGVASSIDMYRWRSLECLFTE
jgi:hypothetical protein